MSISSDLQEMVDTLCRAEQKNIIVDLEGETAKAKFSYNAELVPLCGASGGRWNKTTRTWDWSLYSIPTVADQLKKAKLPLATELAAGLMKVYDSRASFRVQLEEKRRIIYQAIAALPDLDGRILRGMITGAPPLRPFQNIGVGFAELSAGSCIIADEMGLGKTPQALGYLAMHPELRPAVIFVPNPAVCQWEGMIRRWLGTWSIRLDKKAKFLPEKPKVIVVPWSMVDKHKALILECNPKAFVFDEGHYIKGISTKRTQAVFELSRHPGVMARLFLTGTPMLNRPVELWPMLNVITRGGFGGFNEFRQRYCGPKVMKFGSKIVTTYDGATNTDELATRLVPLMIRRLKVQVAPEIPKKSREVVMVESDSTSLSAVDREALKIALEKKEQKKMFEVMAILRRLCGQAKIKNCIDWATDFLESSEEKIVLFAYHVDVQKALIESLQGFGLAKFIAGQTINERGREQANFQTNPSCRVAVCSISAAREAIDLTAASNLAFVERDWVPGVELQAEDRIHRLTTTKPVTIYRLMSDHILDKAIAACVDEKTGIFQALFEGIEGKTWNHENLTAEISRRVLELDLCEKSSRK